MSVQRLRVATALMAGAVAITIVPVVSAQTIPYEPPEARMGHPPGLSSRSTTATTQGRVSIPPGDEERSLEGTVSTYARLTLPPGSSTEARSSSWQVFVAWLQALRIASQ